MFRQFYIISYALLTFCTQPTSSIGISSQWIFLSTGGARSSSVILDSQGPYQTIKTKRDGPCLVMLAPDDSGLLRSFSFKNSTEKVLTCGRLDVSSMSWWPSLCSRKQALSHRRSNLFSEVAIAIRFLQETILRQRVSRISSQPFLRFWGLKQTSLSSRLDQVASFLKCLKITWSTALTSSKKVLDYFDPWLQKLLLGMLEMDPYKRISAAECL